VLLRGVQEVIERDALVGGWWGRYPVEEWPADSIRQLLEPEIWRRASRPNLTYRFYRIRTPFSRHVTLVSQSGEDDEGWIFSVGSACRETRAASWKACNRSRRIALLTGNGRQPKQGVPTTFSTTRSSTVHRLRGNHPGARM
jgi:hypothetical protein